MARADVQRSIRAMFVEEKVCSRNFNATLLAKLLVPKVQAPSLWVYCFKVNRELFVITAFDAVCPSLTFSSFLFLFYPTELFDPLFPDASRRRSVKWKESQSNSRGSGLCVPKVAFKFCTFPSWPGLRSFQGADLMPFCAASQTCHCKDGIVRTLVSRIFADLFAVLRNVYGTFIVGSCEIPFVVVFVCQV